jgi:hypothetical protein
MCFIRFSITFQSTGDLDYTAIKNVKTCNPKLSFINVIHTEINENFEVFPDTILSCIKQLNILDTSVHAFSLFVLCM